MIFLIDSLLGDNALKSLWRLLVDRCLLSKHKNHCGDCMWLPMGRQIENGIKNISSLTHGEQRKKERMILNIANHLNFFCFPLFGNNGKWHNILPGFKQSLKYCRPPHLPLSFLTTLTTTVTLLILPYDIASPYSYLLQYSYLIFS